MSKNIWVTSDTHYNHINIIKYCDRPFSSVEEMNEKMIENYNNLVKIEDEVYFLGDFSFFQLRETLDLLKRLNGYKHLILGNHDKVITKNLKAFQGTPYFSSIDNYKEIKIGEQVIVLFHFGQRVWNKSHYSSWHLYGHSHNNLPPHGKSVDVGVDSSWITGNKEYRPFNFDEIKTFMDKQQVFATNDDGY
ncbi:MAG: metallophosphoesterase [Chitinophagales bacterium]|nr:metallophosphoesterase [Chitinophagales bacterium]